MERFTRFIEWPDRTFPDDSTKPFRILVIGDNPFGPNFEKLFPQTSIKGRKVEVDYESKLDTSQPYPMIFIASNMTYELPSILKHTYDKPIITVSDTKGFGAQGVLINFFVERNRIRFEINQETARMRGLKISHLLLQTGKVL